MLKKDKLRLFAADIFFPNRCPFCGEFIKWDRLCCEECRENITFANDVICRSCGQVKCVCNKEKRFFDTVYAAFFFDEAADAVYRFKQSGESNFAALAAEDIGARMREEKVSIPDLIVPVPMGSHKRRKRGHNQAELFGRALSRNLGVPVRRDILFARDTKDQQHEHTAGERKERIKTVIYGRETNLSGKSVIVCDDVMTTGATVGECAKILKAMGAESVIAAVCATTRLK